MALRTGLAGAVAGSIAILAIAFGVYYQYENSTDAPLATPKVWETRALAFKEGRASLRTVWREGRMSYQLRIDPFPPEVAAAVRSTTSVQQHFTLEFLDRDGFRLLSHSIEARELSLVVGADGTVTAIEARGDREMARDVYQRAERWDIRWSFH